MRRALIIDTDSGFMMPAIFCALTAIAGPCFAGGWSAPEIIDAAYGNAASPLVSLSDSGEGLCTFAQERGSTVNLYSAAWNGSSWDAAEEIDDPGGGNLLSHTAAPFASDGTARCAFLQPMGLDYRVVFTNRWDGARWTNPTFLTGGAELGTPQLASSRGGAALCAYILKKNKLDPDYSIMSRLWNGSWEEEKTAIGSYRESKGFNVALAADGSALCVASQEEDALNKLRYSRWDGSGWSSPLEIPGNGHTVWSPRVVFYGGGKALLAFRRNDGSADRIYAARWNGQSWRSPELINDGSSGVSDPLLASSGDGTALCVFSQGDAENSRLYATRWNGQGWSAPSAINAGGGQSREASIGPSLVTNRAHIAASEDGTALCAFRQEYGGADRIFANRWDGSAWEGAVPIDAGADKPNADSPHLACDAAGNALCAFVQSDGESSFKRIYAARYHPPCPSSTPPVPPRAYVTNAGTDEDPGNTVSVIDTFERRVVGSIEVGLRPFGAAVSPDGSRLYVVNNDSGSVSVICTAGNRTTAELRVGVEPLGVAVTYDGRYAFVTNAGESPETANGTVSMIDCALEEVVATIEVGKYPDLGVAVSGSGSKVAVCNYNDNSVSVIDVEGRVVERTIATGFGPLDVCFGPGDDLLYVACGGDPTSSSVQVFEFSSGEVISQYYAGLAPASLDLRPGGRFLFVSDFSGSTLFVLDLSSQTAETRGVAGGPYRGAFTEDGTEYYLPSYGSSSGVHQGIVSVMDADSLVITDTVQVGINPVAVAIVTRPPGGASRKTAYLNLFASPPSLQRDSSTPLLLQASASVPDELIGMKADLLFGLELVDRGIYYAFEKRFRNLVQVNAERTAGIPRFADGFSLEDGARAWVSFLTSGLPEGRYRFVAAVLPHGKNTIAYLARSNIFSITGNAARDR